MANFESLREANIARNIEWTGGASIEDYTWRGCELAGEVGEIVEELLHKDLWDRRSTHLLPELADGVICIDLTTMTMGLAPIPIFAAGSFSALGVKDEARRLGLSILPMLNTIKKLERERRGWPGSRADKMDVDRALRNLMGRIGLIASYCSLNLKTGVAAKFNETSHKVGLVTRMTVEGQLITG